MSTLNRWAADRRARDEQYQTERERHTLQQEARQQEERRLEERQQEARRLEDERLVLHQQYEYQEALAQEEFGELVAERDELADQLRTVLDALKMSIQFVAKWTADHESVIGERALRQIGDAIARCEPEAEP